MSRERWAEAARRFRTKQHEPIYVQREPVSAPREPALDVAAIGRALDEFLSSEEGRVALDLLTASKQWINVSEEREGGGFCAIYFLGGDGLSISNEGSPRIRPVATAEG